MSGDSFSFLDNVRENFGEDVVKLFLGAVWLFLVSVKWNSENLVFSIYFTLFSGILVFTVLLAFYYVRENIEYEHFLSYLDISSSELNFNTVETVLRKLFKEYPEGIEPSKLESMWSITKGEYNSAKSYLQNSGYIDENEGKLKITLEGIEFYKERRASKRKFKSSMALVLLTAVLAFSSIGAFFSFSEYYYTTGTLECPKEIYSSGVEYEPVFSNHGEIAPMSWSIESENLSIELTDAKYEKSDSVSIGKGDSLRLDFSIKPDGKLSEKASFVFKSSYSNPFRDGPGKECRYKLVDGRLNLSQSSFR